MFVYFSIFLLQVRLKYGLVFFYIFILSMYSLAFTIKDNHMLATCLNAEMLRNFQLLKCHLFERLWEATCKVGIRCV